MRITDWATVIEGFGSVGILLFTFYQVCHMRKELRQSNVQTCFSIEREIYEARRRLETADAAIFSWQLEYDSMKEKKQKKHADRTKTLALELEAAKEAFFSEMDRLCSYIIRGQLNGEDFRADWHPLIKELVSEYNEEINKKYEHISELNDLWKCERVKGLKGRRSRC